MSFKKYYPNIPNNKFNALVLSINHNNFVWYIRCEKDEIRSILEYCNLLIEPSKHMKQNQFEFKPFDQVLVRLDYRLHVCTENKPNIWSAATFSHIQTTKDGRITYNANSLFWDECIPYNENTAHLLGTNKPYKEPEPKVWKVTCHKNNEVFHFTDDELKHFIENAVTNNKDIQWFTITYDENNN